MSIESPTGILDIRNATLKVSKLEVTNATGFDTALNNIARNTILLVDSTEQTASNSWASSSPMLGSVSLRGTGPQAPPATSTLTFTTA